jgi:NCAIR mutase (PurE)-related protein
LSPVPDSHTPAVLDFQREQRLGITEGVLCACKTPDQIGSILNRFRQRGQPCLLTRLDPAKFASLEPDTQAGLDYDELSRTAFFPGPLKVASDPLVAVVSGGTSDAPVCLEATRCLEFHGVGADLFQDLGVTGLWRLTERVEEIRRYPVVIVVAGMEGALFSVLGGLVRAPLIAVPTSVGYGVARDGELSLHAALGSCAPGVVTVNVDNGYGAACAALRILNGSVRTMDAN